MAEDCQMLMCHTPQDTPILLLRDHPLTELLVLKAHARVFHNGVKETLTEVRAKYWILKGRWLVKQILHKCLVCRRFEGRPYSAPVPPPLPDFQVQRDSPFTSTGVDFAGLLYVKMKGTVGLDLSIHMLYRANCTPRPCARSDYYLLSQKSEEVCGQTWFAQKNCI